MANHSKSMTKWHREMGRALVGLFVVVAFVPGSGTRVTAPRKVF